MGNVSSNHPGFRTGSESEALDRIAARSGLLERALTTLGFDEKLDPKRRNESGLLGKLAETLGPEVLDEIVSATGLSRDVVLRSLVQHLYKVARFAQSDGSQHLRNVSAVERMIRSGRADLFTS